MQFVGLQIRHRQAAERTCGRDGDRQGGRVKPLRRQVGMQFGSFYVLERKKSRFDLLLNIASLRDCHSPYRLIFLGDYIDRGDDSRAVVELIVRIQAHAKENSVICLLGNHEQMLLELQ